MNIKMLKAALAGLVLSVSGFANAGLIAQEIEQTIDGQNFIFTLNADDYQVGTSSLLTIDVQGDFNSGIGSLEHIEAIIIEGVNYGSFEHTSTESYNVVQGPSLFNAYRFSLDFTFDSATTNLFLNDDILDISIYFAGKVNEQYGWWTAVNGERSGPPPYAAVSFAYSQVPEPSTLAIFALGIIGLATRRFLK